MFNEKEKEILRYSLSNQYYLNDSSGNKEDLDENILIREMFDKLFFGENASYKGRVRMVDKLSLIFVIMALFYFAIFASYQVGRYVESHTFQCGPAQCMSFIIDAERRCEE